MKKLYLAWDDAFKTTKVKKSPLDKIELPTPDYHPEHPGGYTFDNKIYSAWDLKAKSIPMDEILVKLGYKLNPAGFASEAPEIPEHLPYTMILRMFKHDFLNLYSFELKRDLGGYYLVYPDFDLKSFSKEVWEAYKESFNEKDVEGYSEEFEEHMSWNTYSYDQVFNNEMESFYEGMSYDLPSREEIYESLGEDPRTSRMPLDQAKEEYIENQAKGHEEYLKNEMQDPISYLTDIGYDWQSIVENQMVDIDWDAVAEELATRFIEEKSLNEMMQFYHSADSIFSIGKCKVVHMKVGK